MAEVGDQSVGLSDIGSELAIAGEPSQMAQKEERSLELDHLREINRHDSEKEDRRLGVLGRFFGSKDSAVIYVVAFLVLVCAIAVGVLGFVDSALRPIALEFFKTVAIALVAFFAGRSVAGRES